MKLIISRKECDGLISVNGYDITVTREDDLSVMVRVEGTVNTATDTALFTVKKTTRSQDALIEKEFDIDTDQQGRKFVQIELTHTETDLPPRAYVWDLRILRAGEGETFTVETPMEYAAFEVSEVVGDV